MGEFAVQGWQFLSLFSDLKPGHQRARTCFTAAVFLLYSGFPVLFPLDRNAVPFLKNVGHLHGSETTFFTRCSVLWQMCWTSYTFSFCLKMSYTVEASWPDSLLRVSMSGRLADHLKLLEDWDVSAVTWWESPNQERNVYYGEIPQKHAVSMIQHWSTLFRKHL